MEKDVHLSLTKKEAEGLRNVLETLSSLGDMIEQEHLGETIRTIDTQVDSINQSSHQVLTIQVIISESGNIMDVLVNGEEVDMIDKGSFLIHGDQSEDHYIELVEVCF